MPRSSLLVTPRPHCLPFPGSHNHGGRPYSTPCHRSALGTALRRPPCRPPCAPRSTCSFVWCAGGRTDTTTWPRCSTWVWDCGWRGGKDQVRGPVVWEMGFRGLWAEESETRVTTRVAWVLGVNPAGSCWALVKGRFPGIRPWAGGWGARWRPRCCMKAAAGRVSGGRAAAQVLGESWLRRIAAALR